MINKTMIDTILICKGWYDAYKYPSMLHALVSYYHKYYGNDHMVTQDFIFNHFLKPTALEAVKRDSSLVMYLLQPAMVESYKASNHDSMSISEVMYYRCIALIQMIKADTFILPDEPNNVI